MSGLTIQQLARTASRLLGITISVSGGRAHHYADETRSAYWLTREDLEYAATCVDCYPNDAYSHWCAGTGREMSATSLRRLYGREGGLS